jgi:uncharacterized membrane protein HdeD (DUF308 family)
MAQQSTSILDVFKEATGVSIGSSLIMIVLGFLAVFWPLQAGVAVSVVLGWIIAIAGLALLAYAFAARDAGSFIWRMLLGLVYVAGGAYLGLHSQLALESFTLAAAIIFFIGGVVEIVLFFRLRALSGAGWILFEAIMSFLVAFIIVRPWPSSSNWAIGLLVGINLIVGGVTQLIYSVKVRKVLNAAA